MAVQKEAARISRRLSRQDDQGWNEGSGSWEERSIKTRIHLREKNRQDLVISLTKGYIKDTFQI